MSTLSCLFGGLAVNLETVKCANVVRTFESNGPQSASTESLVAVAMRAGTIHTPRHYRPLYMTE